ncbi:DUF3368 domain-containing protein [Anaerolineales bacterium HSG6]|nr:DUF3368 domain-containing protein [Anaerolineales bacterium HSG6]MDM8531655.1 DUF3368 domain-containing protein [Anaerolineales bacterium HSG25]
MIALAWLNQLALIPALFDELHIPQAVYDEIFYKPDAIGTVELASTDWLIVRPVTNVLSVNLLQDQLDAGESEAIVLATELQADLLLIDERRGRRKAIQYGLDITGTLGILIRARQLQLIGPLRPMLHKLRLLPFFISESLYQQTLRHVGE